MRGGGGGGGGGGGNRKEHTKVREKGESQRSHERERQEHVNIFPSVGEADSL